MSQSHNNSYLFLVITFPRLSSTILTTRVLYSYKTHLVGVNIKIHLIFTLWKIFPPFVSKIFANFVKSMCLLGEWINYTYMDYSNTSIFATNDNFENVYMAKLHLGAMQWNPVTNGACLFISCIVTLVFKPWKIITPSIAKQSNQEAKSPSNNPP